jgi:predicted dehydrogenase
MSEKGSVRWGILGTANIARKCLIPAIQLAHNSEIRALGSRSLTRGEATAAEFGIPVTYGSYETLLADTQVDAVYVPLPNYLHHPWTLRALAAGKHVLCEKPLALNADEAWEMTDAAKASDRLLMEALMYRFHPRTQRIKTLVDTGALGDVRLIRAAFSFRYSDLEDYRFRPEMGGGALLDVGCYGVSVARWMMGAEPEQVVAVTKLAPGGVDLTTVGIMRFPGQRMAVVEASFDMALQQTYTIVGTEGAIELPHDAFVPTGDVAVLERRDQASEKGTVESFQGVDQYKLMVEYFANAVLGQQELVSDLEDSVANMQALDALAESGRLGRPVSLPPRL